MKTVLLATLLCVLSIQISNAQWMPEVRLTNDPAASTGGFRVIAADGNVVHTVWNESADGNWEIYYKRSVDGGLSWEANIRLTNDPELSILPTLAISGSAVHVTWGDLRDGNSEIYYKRSIDGGLTWGADTRLTNNSSISKYSSITSSGSNVHIVWFDGRDGNPEIYYKNSIDGGDTWSSDLRLTSNSGFSYIPVVAASGSVVHVAWYDSTAGNWELYYKRSTDNGSSWGADSRLTNNSGESKWPAIAVSGSTVHLSWVEKRSGGTYTIYYKRSTNGGTSWGAEVAVTKKNYFNLYPCLAVNGSIVHLVYQNLSNVTKYDIAYNSSVNGGATWGSEVKLTSNQNNSSNASIAASGTTLHVIFQDDRDGNSEIYYKQKLNAPAGALSGLSDINSGMVSKISLSQNDPNPFNPSTKIRFVIPDNTFVNLVIYDALGKEVETLVNEQLSVGTHEAVWSAGKYSSGVYYYRLTTGEFSQTNKMLLLK